MSAVTGKASVDLSYVTHVVFEVNGVEHRSMLYRRADGQFEAELHFNANTARDRVFITFYQGEHRKIAGPIRLLEFRCYRGDTGNFEQPFEVDIDDIGH